MTWLKCPRCNSDTCPGRDHGGEGCTTRSVEDMVTAPVVAVPRSFTGNEAEAVGLAVAGAVQAIAEEREAARLEAHQTRHELVQALMALEKLVETTPVGTFAAGNVALEEAQALLERLAPKSEPKPEG